MPHARRRWLTLAVTAALLSFGLVGSSTGTAAAASGVFSPAANSDDAEQRPSSVDISSSDLELVTDNSYQQTVGIRFTGVAIPPGATISDAYIQFTSDEKTTVATSLTVVGVDVSNPDTFTTTADNISKRSRTDASVRWTPPGWPTPGVAGVDQRTPNLASIVQEIVNRSSWASGNPMALLVSGEGRRTAKAFDQGAATAPKLHVTWTTGTTPPPPPPPSAPAVELTSPADGATVAGTVVLDAMSGTAAKVEYFLGSTKIAEDLTCCAWDEDWNSTTVADGTYQLTAKATNGSGSTTTAAHTITVKNSAGTPTNSPPSINAGPDQSATLPSSGPVTVQLDGTVTDDGNPAGGTLSVNWSRLTMPSGATEPVFSDPNTADPTVTLSQAGTYVLQLNASDGELQGNGDEVTITVSDGTTTPPPPAKTDLRPYFVGAVGDEPLADVTAGEAVTFMANYQVHDAAPSPHVRLEWFVDGVKVGTTINTSPPPGYWTTRAQSAWTATEGPHTVEVRVDPLNEVDESNETNNRFSKNFTVGAATTPPPTTHPAPADHRAPGAPACPTNVVRPFPPGTTINQQWAVASPPDNITYDLTGVTSTAYPNGGASPFALGNSSESVNICVNGGRLDGDTDDSLGWSYYHDQHNAACIRVVAKGFAQVNGIRCNDVEDGLKFLENSDKTPNTNDLVLYSSGTYFDRVRDDCFENDYTVGGVLHDSLWERCNSGISERPSGDRTWPTPSSETLTLDHMLIGLWETWHEKDNDMGHNAIFKWEPAAANRLVIKCSIFYVPEMSLNGADSMAIPAGTTIDDSACPGSPSTLVWGGSGAYPGDLNGVPLRISTNVSEWTTAVAQWKAAHGY